MAYAYFLKCPKFEHFQFLSLSLSLSLSLFCSKMIRIARVSLTRGNIKSTKILVRLSEFLCGFLIWAYIWLLAHRSAGSSLSHKTSAYNLGRHFLPHPKVYFICLKTFFQTWTHVIDYGKESFYRNHHRNHLSKKCVMFHFWSKIIKYDGPSRSDRP